MIRTELRLHRPASVEEAMGLLDEDAVAVLGGGTVLVPMMSRGEHTCRNLIDLGRAGLDRLEDGGDELTVGARVTYAALAESSLCSERVPLLAEVAAGVTGGAQVRNQATVVGAACYANPCSDAPAVLVALDARLRLCSPSGSREVAAGDFFRGPFATAAAANELVSHVVVPHQQGPYAYEKVKFSEGSWPIVTAVATAGPDGASNLTLGGVCATPVRIDDVDPDRVEEQVRQSLGELWSDELAPGTYRGAVAPGLGRRVLLRQRSYPR